MARKMVRAHNKRLLHSQELHENRRIQFFFLFFFSTPYDYLVSLEIVGIKQRLLFKLKKEANSTNMHAGKCFRLLDSNDRQ
jgi:hypothetical protein